MPVDFEKIDTNINKLENIKFETQNEVFKWLNSENDNLTSDLRTYFWSKAIRNIKNTRSFESQKLAYRLNTWYINDLDSVAYWFKTQPVLVVGGPEKAFEVLNSNSYTDETYEYLTTVISNFIPRYGSEKDRIALFKIFILAMRNLNISITQIPPNIYWTYENIMDDLGEPIPEIKKNFIVAMLTLVYAIKRSWDTNDKKRKEYRQAHKNWVGLLSGMDIDPTLVKKTNFRQKSTNFERALFCNSKCVTCLI